MEKRVGVGFGVAIVRDGRVLLGRRHEDPQKAGSAMHGEGTWTMPGGKLDFGERLAEGASREVFEETGIRVEAADLRLASLADSLLPDVHFVTVGFACEKFTGEPRVMEPDEITEWGWFPVDDLPAPLFPPSAQILEALRDGKIYRG
jgi:8-oxo-dGTP diphosphatase